uniref:Uncharacterized protein n=1 Tax=Arion vulgaris TaxID=1028688 RepID=A0A0B7A740_9EUPU
MTDTDLWIRTEQESVVTQVRMNKMVVDQAHNAEDTSECYMYLNGTRKGNGEENILN